MKLAVIYIKQEELNGMKIIHYHHYGDFMNQAKYHMAPIGIIGGQNKKLHGKTIINFG